MGKASREKGANYERELVRKMRTIGLRADRTAALQANGKRDEGAPDVTLHDFPGLHIEAKRDERMSVDAMVRQAEREAGGRIPVVIYRRNRQPSRVVVRLEWLLGLLVDVHRYRNGETR